jgi:O-antigen/teichoic acid export membrane protein
VSEPLPSDGEPGTGSSPKAPFASGARGSAFSGARWNAAGRGAQRAIRFLVSLVLARLLAPADFGLMAVATTVLNFMDLFRDFGTGQAIIQKREVSQQLLSSLFVMNLANGIGAAVLLVATAPWVAWLFSTPEATGILRVMGIGFGIYSWSVTQRAILLRRLDFRRVAISDGIGALTNAVVAIALAYAGFGVWALAIGYVASSATGTISLWVLAHWRPSLHFARADLREVRSFSINLVGFNLVQNLFYNADTILISNLLGPAALGLWSMGRRLVVFPVQTLGSILSGVLVPALSRVQDDEPRFQRDYLRAVSGLAMVGFPISIGIGIVAEPLVGTLLGAKWAGAVPIVALLAPTVLMHSTTANIGAIYRAKGRTDLLLRWGIFSSVLTLAGYWIGILWGLEGVAWGYGLVWAALMYPAHAIPLRLIHLGVGDLLRALRPFALASALLAVAALGTRFGLAAAGAPRSAILLATIVAGAATYGLALWRLDPPALRDLERVMTNRRVRGGAPVES